MECPKCHKTVGDNDKTCRNCGTKLRSDNDVYAARRKRIADKSTAIDVIPSSSAKRSSSVKKGAAVSAAKLKIAAIAGGALILVVIIIIIISSVTSGKGLKKAKDLSEYIGTRPEVAQTKTEIDFKKSSAFNVINQAVDFDYVVESDEDVTSGGITYPQWAIFINKSKKGNIKSVRYVDFTTIEDSINGEKRDSVVNLDKYNKGADIEDVIDELKNSYYAVTYTKDAVTYTYRYWFKNDSGDRQAVILDIMSDTDEKYQGYESKLVYPNDL